MKSSKLLSLFPLLGITLSVGELSPSKELIKAHATYSVFLKSPYLPSSLPSYSLFSVETYFSNLFGNLANSYGLIDSSSNSGTCGYVAVCALLSYIDTFYDGTTIPEAFESTPVDCTSQSDAVSNSPGVNSVSFSGPQINLSNFLNQYHTQDLEAKLLYDHCQSHPNDSNPLGTTLSDLVDSLSQYRTSWSSLIHCVNYTQYDNDPNTILSRNCLLSGIRAQIANGNPVLVSLEQVSQEQVSAHVVVSYAMDQSQNVINNYGWKDNKIFCSYPFEWSGNDISTGAEFTERLIGYVYLDLQSLPVTHSDNYWINGLSYCGCGNHVIHDYSYTYGQTDLASIRNTYHRAYCKCGAVINQRHFVYAGTSPVNGYYYCAGCGRKVTNAVIV